MCVHPLQQLTDEALSERGVRVYSGWKLPSSTCRFFSRNLKWGEIGCALSHHAVWECALASAEPAVLVVEDDVEFFPKYVQENASKP